MVIPAMARGGRVDFLVEDEEEGGVVEGEREREDVSGREVGFSGEVSCDGVVSEAGRREVDEGDGSDEGDGVDIAGLGVGISDESSGIENVFCGIWLGNVGMLCVVGMNDAGA